MSNLFPQNDQPTEPLPESAPESVRESMTASAPQTPKPRIRSGAVVWGLLVSAAAVFMLMIVVSPANAAAFNAWTGSLGWGGAILVGVVALGAFILIMAVLSAIRGAQRRRSAP